MHEEETRDTYGTPPPPLQPAHRRVGLGVAAPHAAPLAGAGGKDGAGAAAGLRSGVLSLPGQRAGGRRAQSRNTRAPSSSPTILPRCCPIHRLAAPARRFAAPRTKVTQGTCRVDLFFAAPRPDPARNGDARTSAAWWTCGRSRLDELGAAVPLGAGVREQGRDDGLLQSASPRPDLGAGRAAQRAGQGGSAPARPT